MDEGWWRGIWKKSIGYGEVSARLNCIQSYYIVNLNRQAEKFEVYGLKLNGKLTCGENIADLGGVKLALRALKNHLNSLSEPAPLINGLTPYQRFFLAWSQSWRENVKKERAIQLVTIDPHGPNELRCNGTLSNTTDFYEVFDLRILSFLLTLMGFISSLLSI